MTTRTRDRLSLQKKIVLLVSFTTAIMMSMVVWFDTNSLQDSVKEAYVSQISGMTIAINGRYEESRSVLDVQQIFDYIDYKNDHVLSLTLYDTQGNIQASTERGRVGQAMPGHLMVIPKSDETIVERVPKNKQSIPQVRIVAPLIEDGAVAGAVEVVLDSSEETILVSKRVSLIIIVSSIIMTGLLIALWLILRKIVIVPLMALREAAVSIQQGGTHQKLELKASKEMEEVSSAFNDMVDNLEDRYEQLQQALVSLRTTQFQLIQSEKMGALGNLVAGVSHEINTPIGVGITAASYLEQKTKEFEALFQQNKMKKSDLEQYLQTVKESTEMVNSNLHRASDLVRSFKQVSVDQSSDIKRTFHLKEYMEHVVVSLRPALKKTKLRTVIHCDNSLQVYSYPGAISQVMTNFIMNSVNHAFGPDEEGNLVFQVVKKNNKIILSYSDDGRGMPPEVLDKIFDPFFTTNRSKGGTGLGMHIVYNLITSSLGGTIHAQSMVGRGTLFMIEFPMEDEPLYEHN